MKNTVLQNTAKYFLALVLRVLAAILAGVLLLTLVYCIPTGRMEDHLAQSAAVFHEEGVMPRLFTWCTSYLDNYTDAIMLSNAAHSGTESAMVQAMTAARDQIEGTASHCFGGAPRLDHLWHP